MPELPEVETILRGLATHVRGAKIEHVTIRQPTLRWPIPHDFSAWLVPQTVRDLSRRGKYILLHVERGTVLLHLGMSGRWRLLANASIPNKHDHVDFVLSNGWVMRYTDPRRFGAILMTKEPPEQHPLLRHLGAEPLTDAWSAEYLYARARARRVAIKPMIMDSQVVVGVGNIYATEALFTAKIHPAMPAGLLTRAQAERLVLAIKDVLYRAIVYGGTTLIDFTSTEGAPGYFTVQLQVYGRKGLPCVICQTLIQSCTLGQRSTAFCANCQSPS